MNRRVMDNIECMHNIMERLVRKTDYSIIRATLYLNLEKKNSVSQFRVGRPFSLVYKY